MADEIVNRVAKSGLISIDLEDFYEKGERVVYDIKDNLFEGLIVREKEFRAFVKENNWEKYKDKFVAITCSTDAIIPNWAYMILISKIQPFAKKVVFGTLEALEQDLFKEKLSVVNFEEFAGAKVVVKGCSNFPVPTYAYTELTRLLMPYVSSLMFGEPCSTVPVYKRPKK